MQGLATFKLIAHKGDRTCYQGYSIPSGRYAVAVGETTGSVSAVNNTFVIDGWEKYGKTIMLRQQQQNLWVTHDTGWSSEYILFQNESSVEELSDSMAKCLNSEGVFFETASGYIIRNLPSQ